MAAYLNAPGAIMLDKAAPTNQNSLFAVDLTVKGGATVNIVSSDDASNTIWFAPAGTTTFTAGPTMTAVGWSCLRVRIVVRQGRGKR